MSETTVASILYLDGERKDSAILPILQRDLLVRAVQTTDDPSGALEAVKDERINLVARGSAVNAAARLIAALPGKVESLNVLAPPPAQADGTIGRELTELLGGLNLPTILLFGTRDEVSSPQLGRIYQRLLPQARVIFVYDTTADMDRERPEAVAAILRAFILAKDRFVVTNKSGRIYP